MRKNSIRKHVTDESRVAAVILAIQGHKADKKQVVVVEGNDDRDFYSRFIDADECDIIVNDSFSAYKQISAICNKKGYAKRFFMIKDADFDHLVDAPTVDNQMLTDYHDREMFISALDVDGLLKAKFGVDIDSKAITDNLYWLSIAKWYNQARYCKLVFKKKCTVPKVYDGSNDVTIKCCLAHLLEEPKNAVLRMITEKEVKDFAGDMEGADWRQYTNGHDWLKAIAMRINQTLNTTYSYKLDICPYLEQVITFDFFRSTELCHAMEMRENEIHHRILRKAV